MHIAEGVLTTQVLAGGGSIAVIGTTIGLKKLDYERVPRVAVLSSAFFVASLIHVPVGPSSTHLILNGLVGIILGWASFPAILVGLILQAVLFQFGGFTTLGVNTVNMALPAVIVWLLFNSYVQKSKGTALFLVGFGAGFLAVVLSSIFTSLSLLLSGSEFLNAARLIVISNVPVMVIEGTITGSIIVFLKKVKPEILEVGYALVHRT